MTPPADGGVRTQAGGAEPAVPFDAVEPRQLQELRAALANALSTDIAAEIWRGTAERGFVQKPSGERATAADADDLRRAERSRLRRAELFAVSADMTTLILGASSSLPDYRLHPEDVPAAVGFCMFGQPVGVTDGLEPIVAASREVMENGVAMAWYSRVRERSLEPTRRNLGSSTDPIFPMRVSYEGRTAVLPFGEADEGVCVVYVNQDDPGFDLIGDPSTEVDVLVRELLTTWLVMGEPYTSEERVEADRASRRRLVRQGAGDPGSVRLLTLRRTRGGSGEAGAGSRYHHRWVVSGHWRRYWYPSRKEHRPRWIAEHLSGPDGAPLIGGERVRVLRR